MEFSSDSWSWLLAQATPAVNLPMPSVMRFFLLVWVAMVGGCIGSFLNVVVYRLPRGRNLSHPGSACPRCGHAIRPWHNIPVFGWLMLRGRCYDCQAPISMRYPLIEAIVMLLFVLLALAGPLAAPQSISERVHPIWLLSLSRQWIVFGYQATLLCVLLGFALIEADGNPDGKVAYPNSLFVFGLAFGLAATMVEPSVHPFPLRSLMGTAIFPGSASSQSLADAMLGVASGLLLGLASRPVWKLGPMREIGSRFAIGNAMLCGVYLGSLRASMVLTASALVTLIVGLAARRRLREHRLSFSLFLVPNAAIVLMNDYWRTAKQVAAEETPEITAIGVGLAMILILAASLGCRAIASREA